MIYTHCIICPTQASVSQEQRGEGQCEILSRKQGVGTISLPLFCLNHYLNQIIFCLSVKYPDMVIGSNCLFCPLRCLT